jgi:hypothetical protein
MKSKLVTHLLVVGATRGNNFRFPLFLPKILAFHSNQNGVSYYRKSTTERCVYENIIIK